MNEFEKRFDRDGIKGVFKAFAEAKKEFPTLDMVILRIAVEEDGVDISDEAYIWEAYKKEMDKWGMKWFGDD